MALHPDVQRRGQEEVDRVIGSKRLPKVSGRASLLYVEHIMRETIRRRPVAPLGKFKIVLFHLSDGLHPSNVCHMSTPHDNYSDYHIPAGAVSLPNRGFSSTTLLPSLGLTLVCSG